MSENKVATMPFSDYEAACNAIRTKTGTSDLIKSGEMAGLIEGIENGGSTETVDVNIYNTTAHGTSVHYVSDDLYRCDTVNGNATFRVTAGTIMLIEILQTGGSTINFLDALGGSITRINTLFEGYIVSMNAHYCAVVVSEPMAIEIRTYSNNNEPT